MKKFLKMIMLAVITVACIFTAVACASEQDGTSDKGMLYKKIDGVYTIYKYVDEGKGITTLDIGELLEDDITEVRIKKNAFSGNQTLKEIIVPATVKTFDEGAFAGMKALEKLTLTFVGGSANADGAYGDSASATDKAVNVERTFAYLFGTDEYDGGCSVAVKSDANTGDTRYMPLTLKHVVINASQDYKIPMYAFNGCVNLNTIELNGAIAEIGEYAFADCKNLVNVSIPASVQKIRKGAFANCSSLADNALVNISSVAEIGESAFENAKVNEVVLAANAQVGAKAFAGSKIKKLTISGSVAIGVSAFSGCEKLTTVLTSNIADATIAQFAFKGATALVQFGGTANTFDLTGFAVENLAFADIFENSTDITVVGNSNANAVFGW